MRNLAKNSTYVIVIYTGCDAFNPYSAVYNAYKIKGGERTPLPTDNEIISMRSDETQMAKEYLTRIGYNVPRYLPRNVVVFEKELKSKRALDSYFK